MSGAKGHASGAKDVVPFLLDSWPPSLDTFVMPELPEVETIAREMRGALVGKILKRVFIFDKKLPEQPIKFPLEIKLIERLGKYIVCKMTNGVSCLLHLRMTGELLLEGSGVAAQGTSKPIKHERARFHFRDGSVLRFVDVRRFGTISWLNEKAALPRLGLEPLSRKFNSKNFNSAVEKSARAIKSLLLDQRRVSGIGNIYADESLWTARIHPRRSGNSLKPAEVWRMVLAIKKVLREAIRKGGFTLRDYHRLDGSEGNYQKSRRVYDREGEQCFRCGVRIKRIKIGGRSAYFCPKCQQAGK